MKARGELVGWRKGEITERALSRRQGIARGVRNRMRGVLVKRKLPKEWSIKTETT